MYLNELFQQKKRHIYYDASDLVINVFFFLSILWTWRIITFVGSYYFTPLIGFDIVKDHKLSSSKRQEICKSKLSSHNPQRDQHSLCFKAFAHGTCRLFHTIVIIPVVSYMFFYKIPSVQIIFVRIYHNSQQRLEDCS